MRFKSNNASEGFKEIELFYEKLQMPDRVVKVLTTYDSLKLDDASPHKHFNVIIKKCIRMPSVQRASLINRCARIFNSTNKEIEPALANVAEKWCSA